MLPAKGDILGPLSLGIGAKREVAVQACTWMRRVWQTMEKPSSRVRLSTICTGELWRNNTFGWTSNLGRYWRESNGSKHSCNEMTNWSERIRTIGEQRGTQNSLFMLRSIRVFYDRYFIRNIYSKYSISESVIKFWVLKKGVFLCFDSFKIKENIRFWHEFSFLLFIF